MRASEAFRRLGFVRFGDYVVERLGVSPRTAQEMVRVEAALAALPRVAAARDSGALSSGRVRLVTRVATPETEEYWVSLARRAGVRALARSVAAESAEGMGACGDAAGATDGVGAGAMDRGDDRGREIAVEIRAPVSVIRMWRDTVALVRQLLGHAVSSGECLEAVLAELSGASGGGGEADGGGGSADNDGRDLHASAPPEAARFVRAIESDESTSTGSTAVTPERTGSIRLRVAAGVHTMWLEHLARCRRNVGGGLEPWQALVLAMHDFWRTWDNVETRRQRRDNPALERDGWRCTAPACRALGTGGLEEHHVAFRSARPSAWGTTWGSFTRDGCAARDGPRTI